MSFQPVSQSDHHLATVLPGADFLSQTRWIAEKPQISALSKLLEPFLDLSSLSSWISVTLPDMYDPRNNAALVSSAEMELRPEYAYV